MLATIWNNLQTGFGIRVLKKKWTIYVMYEEACLAYGLNVLNDATKDRYSRLNVGIKKPFNLLGFI